MTTEGREALRTVLEFLHAGNVLMVTRIDRLARSIGDLQDIVRTGLAAPALKRPSSRSIRGPRSRLLRIAVACASSACRLPPAGASKTRERQISCFGRPRYTRSCAHGPSGDARPQKVRFCTTILRAIVMPAASSADMAAMVTLSCQVMCCDSRPAPSRTAGRGRPRSYRAPQSS